ncbi:unnamed protein product [Rotaria sordida]|uniref:Coiled-coil domain-containing protein 89 n=2 Tax=Rotaria sordida TaxID=392033 RepID=A0A815BE54_9BILA|nr:unnamed protein product [Rotaria sordida]CAF1138447.1 unnamed protein product [Rotaria sordida]CAF1141148.1 unnamed protein product [Rotaria sordida]CAF1268476.1 unnamed protein product [Rotaria sordida]CAF4111756.1 unnamed protein product [Rotaria sordida]
MADQSDEIISRLRGISSDEKSEMGKMKCRIDDQARLIMMLKKRNDEYILANMALDKHSIELERQIEELRDKLEEEERLKDKIEELRKTIEQLKTLNIQWELKEQELNKRFLFENNKYENLQQELSSQYKKIQTLEKLLEESYENFHHLKHDSNKQFQQRDQIIDNQRIEINQIRTQLRNLEQIIEEKEKTIQQIEQGHLNQLDQLQINKQSLEQQTKQLEKRLHEYMTNEEKLRQKLTKTEHLLNEANQRFINEEERVNCDLRVEKAQLKYIESEEKIEKLQQEFIAYKNYTSSLLNKEKLLNERLQQLFNGKTT